MHLHHEHAEWVARGLRLADRLGRPSAVCQGAAACWAVQDGDTARGLSLAERGAGFVGEDIDVALCQIWRAEALAEAGMVDEAQAVVPVLRAVAVGQSPLWLRVAAWSAIANAAVAAPSPSSAALLHAFADFCEQVGSTELRASKFFYEGHVCLYATAPPEADRAIDCYREAARLAGATGNDQLRLWAEFGVTCAAVLDREADAGVAIRRSLADGYAVRKWNLTLSVLEAIQLYLVGTGALEEAATVAGFVDLRPPPWGQATAPYREIVAHAVAAEPDAAAWRARGAAMDRHDIVGFALGLLPEAPEV